jgi:hypothetical protein
MLHKVWAVLNGADAVVGHNVKRFDLRMLRGEWALLGLKPHSTVKAIDTLITARREFGLESNTLGALCTRFGIPTKTDKYDARVAQAAVDGDRKAQLRLERYCKGDVRASTALYDRLRGWDHTHPILQGDKLTRCNQCGSDDLHSIGDTTANVLAYPAMRCGNCGANIKLGHSSRRVAVTRGIQ